MYSANTVKDLVSSSNPYRPTVPPPAPPPSHSTDRPIALHLWKLTLWLAAYSCPVIVAGCFYMSWFVAWIVLGHKPRPMVDDPKSIGGLMDIAYIGSMVAFLSAPILAPIGFIASFVCPFPSFGKQRMRCAILVAVYLGICVTILLTIKADPGRVIEWWLD